MGLLSIIGDRLPLSLPDKRTIWNLLRPYKDFRFKLNVWILRPSIDVEGILNAIIGPDPAASDTTLNPVSPV